MEKKRLTQRSMVFVLAGGRGSRLKELTDRRVKPAVPFGGKARIFWIFCPHHSAVGMKTGTKGRLTP